MKRKPQHSLDSKQTSIITALYRAWDQQQVPAIHYHYMLAILAKQAKKQQIKLMSRELNRLKEGKDHYHTIMKWINVRQNSLAVIKSNVSVLRHTQNSNELEWSQVEQDATIEEFKLVYESRTKQRRTNRKLEQLISHIKNYQLSTYEVTKAINNWEHQIYEFYYDGFVQFLYRHQDYLEKMLNDSTEVTEEYGQFFEKNMFLIFKKDHQFTQYSLIYENLRFHPDFAVKIEEALQVISNHHAELQRYRILGSYKQLGSRKKLEKIQSMKGIYCSYNRNTIIVRDRQLVGDKLKFIQNKNVLINPQAPTLTRFSQQYPVMVSSRDKKLSRNNSEIRLQPLSHRTKIVVNQHNFSQIDDKVSQRKLMMLQDLTSGKASSASLPHAPSTPYANESLKLKEPDPIRPKQQSKPTQTHLTSDRITEYKIEFIYEKDINPKDIFQYMRSEIFNESNRDSADIQAVVKEILEERHRITFIRAIAKSMLVAWLAVIFVTKDHSLKKSVQVKAVHKFLKIPNFESELVEEFFKKGYGIVKMNGKVMSECVVKDKIGHPLVYVHYKLREEDEYVLKKVIKSNELLKSSRILKYYTYSKDSKYHAYCEHRKNQCKVSFQIEQVAKISIEGETYLKAKCDSIKKVGAVWKITHHLNKLALLIGQSLNDIVSFGQLSDIDFNSSFQSPNEEEQKNYLCLPESKCMHKYVNSQEKSVVAQYLKINGQIPEIRSLRVDRKQLRDSLIVERPFVAALVCISKQDYGKTVAVLNFD